MQIISDKFQVKKSYAILAVFAVVLFARADDDLFKTLDEAVPIREDADIPQSILSPTQEFFNEGRIRIRDFYRRRVPESQCTIHSPDDGEKVYYKTGDKLRNCSLKPGTYSIIRYESKDYGYYIRYMGQATTTGKDTVVGEIFEEIESKDILVSESFDHFADVQYNNRYVEKQTQEKVGEVLPLLEPESDSEANFVGTRQFLGAKFSVYRGGDVTSIGASFGIKHNDDVIARAIVVDTDRDLATLYIIDATREVIAGDNLIVK